MAHTHTPFRSSCVQSHAHPYGIVYTWSDWVVACARAARAHFRIHWPVLDEGIMCARASRVRVRAIASCTRANWNRSMLAEVVVVVVVAVVDPVAIDDASSSLFDGIVCVRTPEREFDFVRACPCRSCISSSSSTSGALSSGEWAKNSTFSIYSVLRGGARTKRDACVRRVALKTWANTIITHSFLCARRLLPPPPPSQPIWEWLAG